MKARKVTLSLALLAAPALALVVGAAPAPPVHYAGTYFFETVTQSTGDVVNGFLTLHRNGTCTWADQSDFGGNGFFNSTTHGVWRRTGPDEVTIEGYYYRFDEAGSPVVLVRITSVGSLLRGEGLGRVDVFAPDQNPVTESPWLPNADAVAITTFRVE